MEKLWKSWGKFGEKLGVVEVFPPVFHRFSTGFVGVFFGAAGVVPAAPLVPRFWVFAIRSASLVCCERLTRGRRHGWRQSGLARVRKPRPLRRGEGGGFGGGCLK